MQKLIVLFSIFVVIASCGMPQKDKEEIAIITCNVMAESRNMDAAMRIKEINSAREKIGEERFLLTDESIKESFKYGLCKNLVLNDSYFENLDALKAIEAEELRIAGEKAEEERIAREKKAEKERIAREKKAEEERIAREKKAEEERIAREKKAEAERIAIENAKKKYRQSILSAIEGYKLEVKRAWVRMSGEEVRVSINCKEISDLKVNLAVKFESGVTRYLQNQRIYCTEKRSSITQQKWVQDFNFMSEYSQYHPETKALMESFGNWGGSGHVLEHIDEFEIKIISGGSRINYINFSPLVLESHAILDEPIVLIWRNET